ncbi:hypothetical protein T492DRAFT_897221 [Pavlovales sp. CCMP2436]|nr:hypothetical protein T492DRAFT_897221 [Pavlovales sp. CCMP2436]
MENGPKAQRRFIGFLAKLCADPAFYPGDEGDESAVSFDEEEARAICEAHRALTHGSISHGGVNFQPEYGAAVLYRCAPEDDSRLHLEVIGLDGWEFGTTSALPNACEGARSACEPVVLYVGSFETGRCNRFATAFEAILDKVQKRSGEAHHADNSNGGHQKTPAFIEAVAQNAVRAANTMPAADGKETELDYSVTPRGGFTDVGRHTGGSRRETELPLTLTCDTLLSRYTMWDAERLSTARW